MNKKRIKGQSDNTFRLTQHGECEYIVSFAVLKERTKTFQLGIYKWHLIISLRHLVVQLNTNLPKYEPKSSHLAHVPTGIIYLTRNLFFDHELKHGLIFRVCWLSNYSRFYNFEAHLYTWILHTDTYVEIWKYIYQLCQINSYHI